MNNPTVKLIGEDGNIFNILGKCAKALKDNGQNNEATELTNKVFASSSYEEALTICMEYVNVE